MEPKTLPKLAFLGPIGTFSHQVAYNYFGDAVTYQPKPSIANIFASLSLEIPFACLPLANSTHGAVIETLDLFRSDRWSKTAFIRDEVTLKIEHCLFVTSSNSEKGDNEDIASVLDSIVCVYSHEQALGQCSGWLDRCLPWAKRVKTDSTAGAGQRIINGGANGQTTAGREAAICSEICLRTQPGLRLVKKGIQDRGDNLTRFAVVAYNSAIPFPIQKANTAIPPRTLIRISPKTDNLGNILSLLSAATALGFKIWSMDRRPALEGETWSDVYFIGLRYDSVSTLREPLPNLVTDLRRHADVVILGNW